MDNLVDQLDGLTREAHDIDAWCQRWIALWMAMEQGAGTPAQRARYRHEADCWSRMRARSLQAIYAEINRLLRRADG